VLLTVAALCAGLAGCTPSARTASQSPRSALARHVVPQRSLPQPPLGDGVQGVRLLVEPDDGKRRLTRPIRDAQRTIDLTMYLLTDHTLIHDLEYAAASGVRVRVILERAPFGDGASTRSANQSAYDQLYAADIPVRWSSSRYMLTHQKTMIVDDATAYILTMNYTYSSERFQTQRRPSQQ
jgi:phosphatidylserine/phosphatidylglycerophosphate/cardiolipin synthase-like enzyme